MDRVIATIDPLGQRATMQYDAAGRAMASIDLLGYATSFTHDAAGRRTAVTDARGGASTTIYAPTGRTAAMVDALGNRATLAYDAAGRQVAVTNALGYTTTNVYDAAGRRAAVIDRLGYRATTVYHGASRQVAMVDANGGRNTYTHDAAGRIVQQADPLGRLTTFTYDRVGRQTSILDARGIHSTFQYDAANQLTARLSTNDATVTYSYDELGNRIEALDGTGRSTFTYDLLNRRAGAVDPAGHTITYSYNGIGQRVGMAASQIGQFTYAYDPRGQISHLINPQGDRTTFSYDSAARRTLTELANGTRTSYTYDAASRVQQLYNLKADGGVILGLTYEHDPVGNPTSMLESTGDRVTWTYDATDRLTREQRSGPSAYDNTYTYDGLDNRLVKDASGVLTTSTYDLANQLVTSQDVAGTTTYTYDLAGNLQVVEQPSGQRTTTTWDDQNRQTGVLFPDGSAVTNTYRFDGLRYSKQDPQSTTKFLWDVNNYLAETNDQDDIQAVYTNEPQQYGNLISQYRKKPTLWLPSYNQYDALGATRVLTNDAGDMTDTYLYDAWGNELAVSGSTHNPFRWVGQVGYYWDEGMGTLYIRARVYEPVTGRWMSQDPLLFPSVSKSRNGIRFPKAPSHIRLRSQTSGNREDEVNLYRACCVPNGTDPSGLECHPEDHHWLAQQFGPRIEALCKPHFPTFSIHLYTTTLQRCSGKDACCDAHGWLHGANSYNPYVGAALALSEAGGTCCTFLFSMTSLMSTTMHGLQTMFSGWPCKQSGFYDLHRWRHPNEKHWPSWLAMLRTCGAQVDPEPIPQPVPALTPRPVPIDVPTSAPDADWIWLVGLGAILLFDILTVPSGRPFL